MKSQIKNPKKPAKTTTSIDSNTSDKDENPTRASVDSSEFIVRRKGAEKESPARRSSANNRKLVPPTQDPGSPQPVQQRHIGSITHHSSPRHSIADDYDIHDKRAEHGTTTASSSGTSGTSSYAGDLIKTLSGVAITPLQQTLNQFDPSTSWENWWIHSPPWRRKLVFLLIVIFLMGIMQLLAAIAFFALTPGAMVRDPYVCTTGKCRQLAKWIGTSSNVSGINPCQDFYSFVCSSHKVSDTGGLYAHWYNNFARLESDGENGESILAKVLTKPADSDIIAQRIVKFYQICLEVWQTKTLELEKSLTELIHHVFHEFDLWEDSEDNVDNLDLEYAAVSMINLLGDYGFFKTLAPVGYPDILIETWTFTSRIKPENVARFLPTIFSALNITGREHRHKISQNLYYMANKIDALNKGHHKCVNDATTSTGKAYLSFKLPFYLAYHGRENINISNHVWILKNEKLLNIKLDPLGWDPDTESYDNFETSWNCWMQARFNSKEKKMYMRATYATFWSLRLLIELVHDADAQTEKDFDLTRNPFFEVYTKRYAGRNMESRCYESLFTAMGFYPIFAYFDSDENQRLTTFDNYQDMAVQVFKHAASALLEQFRPMEEGGMPWISSRYRERVYRLLSSVNLNDINILVPLLDDDPTYPEQPEQDKLEIVGSHVRNIINWREFLFRRTKNFWLKKSPQGKLVWYRDFYLMDTVVVYESPSAAIIPIINVPPSMFSYPYWNNDMEIANYAGARVMAAKIWLKLLQFDSSERNVKADIKHRRADEDEMVAGRSAETDEENSIRDVSKDVVPYREGVVTDADDKPCEVLTYNWFHPSDDTETKRRHSLTPFDPHFLAFRYGHREYGDRAKDGPVERSMGAFQISLAWRTMLHKYYEEVVHGLREQDFSDFSEETFRRLMHQKLINHDNFSESQLFFLLTFRQMCRSFTPSDAYFAHVAENVAALVHMNEFAKSWTCPPNSPMNPVNKCFRT